MKIPKIPPNSFLDFQEGDRKQTVVANGEGIKLRHLVNLIPGLLLGLLSLALVYFSLTYFIVGVENKIGTTAIGLFNALFVAAFGLIVVRKTVQAAWGTTVFTVFSIDSNKILKVVHIVPIPWLAGSFPNKENPLKIALNDVRDVRTVSRFSYSSLWILEKRCTWLPMRLRNILSCRCKRDLEWIQSWIESHRPAR